MRVLITGATGYLGTAMAESVPAGIEPILTGLSRGDRPLDVTDPVAIAGAIEQHRPGAVVHLAAVSGVDVAAGDLSRARRVNVEGAAAVAAATERAGVRLVTLSSDVVFGGADSPYDENSRPDPINEYGRSKLAGETAVLAANPDALILRTTVLVGRDRAGRFPFSAFVLGRARGGLEVELFENELRNFFPVTRAATAVWECAAGDHTGILHIGAITSTSRYEFGCRVLLELGLDEGLAVPVQGPPDRPADLTLDVSLASSLLNTTMPTISQCIEETVRDLSVT